MATTRIISMHVNKGKSIAQSLTDRTQYASNPGKTHDGEYISAYACDPATVDAEFLAAKRIYSDITGREQRSNVIAYQIRQSFKPGELTPDAANRIGYELAMRWTKGRHAFIVATHVDKAHIHNHIIYNSTSLDCSKKFRDFIGSGRAVRRLSDTLCLENGLSIITQPKRSKTHYGRWLGDEKPLTFADRLRAAIDTALSQKPGDFDGFLKLMLDAGYEIKRNKHIAFKGHGQKNFIRLRSLGEGYFEDDLRAVLSGEKARVQRTTSPAKKPERKVDLLVDIQAKLQAGKGVGYERWAKVFNLKQMAQTLNYLSENKLSDYAELSQKAADASARYRDLSRQIKDAEKRMAQIAVLKTHIINYAKTRETYIAYRKAGYSKKFYEAHTAELLLHKAAKSAFDELGIRKLPSVKTLNAEYAELLSSKKAAYAGYARARAEMRELLTVKENVARILNIDKDAHITQKERGARE